MSGIAAAASVALLGVLMAFSSSASALVAPATAGPPKRPPFKHLDLDGFFPSVTQIHVGDSVSWSINGFHTVTFLAAGQPEPPLIVPASANPLSGLLDAAKAPFWFNGQPKQIINPVAAFPAGGNTYSGTGYLNSGTPSPGGPPKPFVVKFTKAGTFTFNCLVHPGMKGVVTVLPAGKHVPTAAQDRAAANAQGGAAFEKARKLAKVKLPAATVLAGHDGGSVAWLRFFPQNLKIKVGTTVDFKLSSKREIHTITFGPAAFTSAIESTFTAPQPNPAGPPTILVNPLGSYPSDPPPLPPYTGANHGNGFEGTGILAAGGGPLPSSAKITFLKPGVFKYECVVHENMDGTITVTK
jgi:plastocyanin